MLMNLKYVKNLFLMKKKNLKNAKLLMEIKMFVLDIQEITSVYGIQII